jgi:teichuronic acid biosynthesis glycosyltransferase TuaG
MPEQIQNRLAPKLSVIVTTFNRKEYLTETIQSILDQSYQDFELIVVDNYSNYDFLAFIDSFKSEKIFPIQNNNNGVIAINRNVGISHAEGKYLAFCDDDDVWVKNKLHDQMIIINETQCDIVYSDMFLFKEDISNIVGRTSNNKTHNLKEMIKRNPINTSSVLVRNENILFPEDPNLLAVEDYSLWLNLFIKGFRFAATEYPTVYFRISGSNTSGHKKMYSAKHLKLIYLYISLLIQNPNLQVKRQIMIQILINMLKYFYKEKFCGNK